jgi:hypothetical protein
VRIQKPQRNSTPSAKRTPSCPTIESGAQFHSTLVFYYMHIRRREYDRMLASSQPDKHDTGPLRNQQPQWSYEWSYEIRRNKGATYAWESVRRSKAGHHPGPTYGRYPRNPSEPHYGDPFPFPQSRRGERPTSRQTDANRLDYAQGEWRALQIIVLVIFIATVGGGLGANA